MPTPLDGEPRLLVLDAYALAGREALAGAGGTPAGDLYRGLLSALVPDATLHVAFAADADPGLPPGGALADFDGAVWTGSSLTIHHDEPAVRRQIELARALLDAGVPNFGSCWAAQVAAVAAGGSCAASPKGREFGVARDITLTDAGRAHPLFRDKPDRFDAWCSHGDEVVSLPADARLLASNDFSRVQALEVFRGGTSFQAVQYHPEYDAHEVARLATLRGDELIAQGSFEGPGALATYVEELEALHTDPTRQDLITAHGAGDDLLDPTLRTQEVRNWLESQVLEPR